MFLSVWVLARSKWSTKLGNRRKFHKGITVFFTEAWEDWAKKDTAVFGPELWFPDLKLRGLSDKSCSPLSERQVTLDGAKVWVDGIL